MGDIKITVLKKRCRHEWRYMWAGMFCCTKCPKIKKAKYYENRKTKIKDRPLRKV
jgi:hypothetical protein